MKTFYSIIFIQIRPFINEKVSIGLLFKKDNKIQYKFSQEKLKRIKDILGDKFDSAKFTLESFKKEIKSISQNPENDLRVDLYSIDSIKSKLKHLTNLVAFSDPVIIDIDFNKENFNRLYSKFIYENEEELKENTFESNIKSFKKSLNDKVNIDFSQYEMITKNNDEIPLYPSKIDTLGKNDIYMIGQSINFNKGSNYISADFLKLSKFSQSLYKPKCFIIGEEPEKSNKQSHSIWKLINDSIDFDFTPINETEKIIEYIKEHEVKPIIELN